MVEIRWVLKRIGRSRFNTWRRSKEVLHHKDNWLTITEKYIQLILPYLSGADGGEVETFTTPEGLIGYRFPCPLCSGFVRTEELRTRQLASLTPYKGSFDYLFRCRRSGSKECRGGAKNFHNFLCFYNPNLFRQYQKELLPRLLTQREDA